MVLNVVLDVALDCTDDGRVVLSGGDVVDDFVALERGQSTIETSLEHYL